MLSSSVLDRAITQSNEKKLQVTSNDIKYYENFIELQSLELACFVLAVCNVVIVTEDWFCDPNLLRLLQTSEMLLPNMNSVLAATNSGSSSVGLDEMTQQLNSYEHHPHLSKFLWGL